MRSCIFVVLLFTSVAHSFLSIDPDERQDIFYSILTDTCNCVDRIALCPLWAREDRCDENNIRFLCLVSCGVCDECDPGPEATLEPTLVPCTFDCGDIWPGAFCEFYDGRNLCPFISGLCRSTCGECTSCTLPPNTPPPCDPNCSDIQSPQDCQFWRSRDFCDREGAYPSVPYNCQLTCEICRRCPFQG